MRIRVSHETTYRYEQPAKGVIQTLRMTPRNHDGQYVVDWRIDVSADCRLDAQVDAFGNVTHTFSADGPLEQLRLLVDGEVETQDTHGVVRGTVEQFPPSLFLRATPTRPMRRPLPPRHSGSSAACARTSPTSSSRRRASSASRRAMSPATST